MTSAPRTPAHTRVHALAALTICSLAACTADADQDSPERADSSSPSVATSTPPEPAAPSMSPGPAGSTALPVDWNGIVEPGRYAMTANGRPDAPWAVVDHPEPFSSLNGWAVFDETEDGGGIGYWTVSEVVRNPCRAYGDDNAIGAGDSVEELVAALQRQRRTRSTDPVPVSVDGHRGLSLEVHLPEGINFARCPDYNVWESDPAGARHMGAPGEFDRLWVLDVEGEVVVLTVTAGADTSRASLDRLAGMVESAEIVSRDLPSDAPN